MTTLPTIEKRIRVLCPVCNALLFRVSECTIAVVELRCRRCGKIREVSVKPEEKKVS
jgi:phage FluMu protein Com